jgi:integration host factor subunit alpha
MPYTFHHLSDAKNNRIIANQKGEHMTLTKKDLIYDIHDKTGLDKEIASEGLETFFEIIKSNLSKGEAVSFSGFGKFSVKEKRARRGRNPKTGAELIIAPRRVINFNLSNVLRAKLD